MAADANPIGEAEIADLLHAGRAGVRLHPSVRFEWLQTPAMTIWLAHQRPVGAEIKPEWKAEGALFARPSAFLLHAPRIGPAAHRMLFGVRIGEPLDVALAAASRLYPSEKCRAVLTSLINLGVFTDSAPERPI